MDANLLHISYEGKILEDPWVQPDHKMYRMTNKPDKCPTKGEIIELGFIKGDPVTVNKKKLKPEKLIELLNTLGGRHGIGRKDIVENRTIGMKSRGIYETPGGEILLAAHRAIESLTLDGPSIQLKDELMPKYANLIYDGLWFSPERKMLQALINESQKNVSGEVRLLLRQGSINILGRKSKKSLYNLKLATFEEDDQYNQYDADGYIKLKALRFRN